ncbi:MAG: hypothetical protein NTY14_08445 [Candidatus Omnitrophica bacterium]|nr:hypothetical protein [Candidatus Omnitrophota bacterium]
MNKNSKILVLLLTTIFLALTAKSYSQENQTIPQQKTPELKWMYGSVAKVSFTAGYIMVFSDQGYATFKVTDNTAISIGPKKVGLDEIKTEDSVRVQYYCPEAGKCVAVSISESKKEENS